MKCPHCKNSDDSLLEWITRDVWLCICCSKMFIAEKSHDDQIKEGGTGSRDTKS
jgi:ribosomal protein L37AE/L43A